MLEFVPYKTGAKNPTFFAVKDGDRYLYQVRKGLVIHYAMAESPAEAEMIVDRNLGMTKRWSTEVERVKILKKYTEFPEVPDYVKEAFDVGS